MRLTMSSALRGANCVKKAGSNTREPVFCGAGSLGGGAASSLASWAMAGAADIAITAQPQRNKYLLYKGFGFLSMLFVYKRRRWVERGIDEGLAGPDERHLRPTNGVRLAVVARAVVKSLEHRGSYRDIDANQSIRGIS
ncbi:hypothetical protein [Qipengyuania seohaensis]|uniref:hypothetical protein n=1 Tax=Qipengyuania seohaensis TaxID=266951 RepID=UPI001E389C66|nr:hypothetical protein [Qipengyuania seohaensis]